jgi:two-component system NtrC family sensor kinase
VSILTGLAALPLGFKAGAAYAVGALVLAAASFLVTRQLLSEMEKVSRRSRLLYDELYRSRKLSSVDEISAGIAHEINNPLGIIAQEAQWVQCTLTSDTFKDVKEIDDCRDSLQVISSEVDRCKEIVQKLLNLAREMNPVIQSVDMNDLTNHIADLVDKEVSRRNIRIIRVFDRDLPVVYSDPPLLRQVILNLLDNAAHAVDKDGEITIGTQRAANDSVVLTVKDSGSGIPAANLEKIFAPFFSTKPAGRGTGLGLAICRVIVERLGGDISVTSEVGKYTAFRIRLPIDPRREGEIQ